MPRGMPRECVPWCGVGPPGRNHRERAGQGGSRLWTVVGLAVGAGLFLTYVLVSLGNPKTDLQFTYSPSSTLPTGGKLHPLEAIEWLPHTYDRQRTSHAFWKYLVMGMAFFALRGLLAGRSGPRSAHLSPGRGVPAPAIARLPVDALHQHGSAGAQGHPAAPRWHAKVVVVVQEPYQPGRRRRWSIPVSGQWCPGWC